MARARRGRLPDDEDDDEPDSDEEDEEEPRRRPRPVRPTRPRSAPPTPVQRWRGPEGGDEDDEEPDELPRSRRWRPAGEKPPIFWRARDSLYFEPLVALAIIVLLIVGLFAYTQNWPPIYVVESRSMQHGTTDILGLINTGDLVLAQKVSLSTIVPYVIGLETGYHTYGEYGDVLLYHPNGGGQTPIIHRAILYLDWNPSSQSYNIPDLNGLACGNASNAVYATPGTPGGCGTTGLRGTLELYHIGWRSANVSVDLASPALGGHSGFLTMGDNNVACAGASCVGNPDQSGGTTPQISELVEPGWIIGVARGMVPWFGSVKLLLEGNAGEVPPQSWEFLGLTVSGVILLGFGIHYALRAEGIETPLRKQEEEEAAAEGGPPPPNDEDDEDDKVSERPRRFSDTLRPWRHPASDEEEPTTPPAPRGRHRAAAPDRPSPSRRGRPRPHIRRSEKSRRRPKDEDL